METNDYKTLLNVLKTRFIANLQGTQQEVTDLNEGSNVMTIFESIASILEQAYIDTRLGFQSNLNAIATSIFEFSKKEGQAATVNVVFSRAVPLPTAIISTLYLLINESGLVYKQIMWYGIGFILILLVR